MNQDKNCNSSSNFTSLLNSPQGTIKNCIFTDNTVTSQGGSLVKGKFSFSQNNIYNNKTQFIVVLGEGITSSYDYTNNYWGTKNSSIIKDNLIYDFYDDPNFNTSIANFLPILLCGSDHIIESPLTISKITLAKDSTFNKNMLDSIYIGTKLYIQLTAVDNNKYCPDLTPVYIANLSSQDTVIGTLVEFGDSTGIYRLTASIQETTDNINDVIGANAGDEIKIVSKTDPTKYYSFTVAHTPPPNISNLDIGGTDDISHILDSTPEISWIFSDPLSSPQTHFQVQVGLNDNWNISEIWDTGEISSSNTSMVYAGSTLNEDSTYYVRVRVNNGTHWSSWADTSFALNSHPIIAFIGAYVSEDDTLFLKMNDFISDSDDPDSLLTVSSNGSNHVTVNLNSHEARLIPHENWNGSEKVGFTCIDPWGYKTTDSLFLTVFPVNDAPIITTNELTNAVEDQAYSYTIEATDADLVYGDHLIYSLSVYSEGMTINSMTGEINWLPDNEDVGDTTVTVVVTDDSSATDTQTYDLAVVNVNDPPVFSAIPDTSFNEDARLCKVSGHGIHFSQINRISVEQLLEIQRLVERSETSL